MTPKGFVASLRQLVPIFAIVLLAACGGDDNVGEPTAVPATVWVEPGGETFVKTFLLAPIEVKNCDSQSTKKLPGQEVVRSFLFEVSGGWEATAGVTFELLKAEISLRYGITNATNFTYSANAPDWEVAAYDRRTFQPVLSETWAKGKISVGDRQFDYNALVGLALSYEKESDNLCPPIVISEELFASKATTAREKLKNEFGFKHVWIDEQLFVPPCSAVDNVGPKLQKSGLMFIYLDQRAGYPAEKDTVVVLDHLDSYDQNLRSGDRLMLVQWEGLPADTTMQCQSSLSPAFYAEIFQRTKLATVPEIIVPSRPPGLATPVRSPVPAEVAPKKK